MLTMLAALALAAETAPAAVPAVTPDYAQDDAWLCRPGRIDACASDQTVTVIEANGRMRAEPFVAAADKPYDCFYVYPTVSTESTPNSDMTVGEDERRVAFAQAARFSQNCRVYAPMYRQVTLTSLRDAMLGKPVKPDRAMALADVTAAWRSYLAHDNGGRPVVLIGHSQGSGVLKAMIAASVENEPAVMGRVVSAMLLGTNVAVPAGKAVGGDLKTMPVCTRAGEYGCVVTYVSFRADKVPPANSRFGRVADPAMRAACVNPAALLGHPATSDAIFTTAGAGLSATPMREWVTGKPLPTTPFVRLPGFVTTTCMESGGASYLAVKFNANARDPRLDDIAGDVRVGNAVLADWGLHLLDMPVAMGDLVALSRAQYLAWKAGHPAG